jgi:hypothetical protein
MFTPTESSRRARSRRARDRGPADKGAALLDIKKDTPSSR